VDEDIKNMVREFYGKIASGMTQACGPGIACGLPEQFTVEASRRLGYPMKDLQSVPEAANLGLGCANPIAEATLREGEIVLDLGCGAGLDCFLAANRVGQGGHVIGLDLTPEMIERAKENTKKGPYGRVEFREGDIEELPFENASMDVILSNCSINLAPDKGKVFHEAYRVLKPDGRLIIADIVLLEPLPDILLGAVDLYVGCLAGAMMRGEYLEAIGAAGFKEVGLVRESPIPIDFIGHEAIRKVVRISLVDDEIGALEKSVLGILVAARK
jgi:arsenite methyltransferase